MPVTRLRVLITKAWPCRPARALNYQCIRYQSRVMTWIVNGFWYSIWKTMLLSEAWLEEFQLCVIQKHMNRTSWMIIVIYPTTCSQHSIVSGFWFFYWMFWIGGLSWRFSASLFCDFWRRKKTAFAISPNCSPLWQSTVWFVRCAS